MSVHTAASAAAAAFSKIVFPEAPKDGELEIARHIGREFALSVPGSDRHMLLGGMFKLMNQQARDAAHKAYDDALCAH